MQEITAGWLVVSEVIRERSTLPEALNWLPLDQVGKSPRAFCLLVISPRVKHPVHPHTRVDCIA